MAITTKEQFDEEMDSHYYESVGDERAPFQDIIGLFATVEFFYLQISDVADVTPLRELAVTMLGDETITGKEAVNPDSEIHSRIKFPEGVDEEDRNFFEAISTSFAFAVDALRAHDAGNSDEAWRSLAQAKFYAGLVLSVEIAKRYKDDVDDVKRLYSRLARDGAAKRHAPMNALKEWTLDRYRKGTWRSANEAAHKLKDEVVRHGESIGARLMEHNACNTIAKWIRESNSCR